MTAVLVLITLAVAALALFLAVAACVVVAKCDRQHAAILEKLQSLELAVHAIAQPMNPPGVRYEKFTAAGPRGVQ